MEYWKYPLKSSETDTDDFTFFFIFNLLVYLTNKKCFTFCIWMELMETDLLEESYCSSKMNSAILQFSNLKMTT